MTKHTRAKWAARVEEWRASGLSAAAFAAGKDYEASALAWAVRQLGLGAGKAVARRVMPPAPTVPRGRPRTGRSVRAPPRAPRFLPVRVAEPAASEVVVEVGGARVRVTRGVDIVLLGEVVRALQGSGR